MRLMSGDKNKISELMRENLDKRKASQPIELPSAGSYFKRPERDFAGRLIEECGLKGETVGGAQVSPKHAGFIVNVGGASFYDVLALEEKIKERVMSRFGVMLCREVRLIEDR
jgi:UDP-N-acetylmuramate dehydrogenase